MLVRINYIFDVDYPYSENGIELIKDFQDESLQSRPRSMHLNLESTGIFKLNVI